MENPNPYASPAAPAGPLSQDPAAFRELVGAWEKLRLIYNALLILPGIGVIALWVSRTDLSLSAGVVLSIPVAIGANVAFCLGPMCELYFRAIFRAGAPIGKGRWLIFSAGIVVSAGIFLLAAIMGYLAGNP